MGGGLGGGTVRLRCFCGRALAPAVASLGVSRAHWERAVPWRSTKSTPQTSLWLRLHAQCKVNV